MIVKLKCTESSEAWFKPGDEYQAEASEDDAGTLYKVYTDEKITDDTPWHLRPGSDGLIHLCMVRMAMAKFKEVKQ